MHTEKPSFLHMMLTDTHNVVHKANGGAPDRPQKPEVFFFLSLTGNDTPKSQFDWHLSALVLYPFLLV